MPRVKVKRARTKKSEHGKRGSLSVPCPHCGSPSRVFRTTLGERLRTSRRARNFVVRDRRCIKNEHRFITEEHAKP